MRLRAVFIIASLLFSCQAVYPQSKIYPQQVNTIKFANQFIGASVTAKIDAATASCSTNPCLVVIPSTVGAGAPSAYASNVTIWDFRAGAPINGSLGNSVSTNASGSGVSYGELLQQQYTLGSGSSTAFQSNLNVTGTIPSAESHAAITGAAYGVGTLAGTPTTGNLMGGEFNANSLSTGGTWPVLRGGTFSVSSACTAPCVTPTAITNAAAGVSQAFIKGTGGATPVNAYGWVDESQGAASVNNYSHWFQGSVLTTNSSTNGGGGFDWPSNVDCRIGSTCNGQSWFSTTATGTIVPFTTFGGTAGANRIGLFPLVDTAGWLWETQGSTQLLNMTSTKAVFGSTGGSMLVGINPATDPPLHTLDIGNLAAANDTLTTIQEIDGGASQGGGDGILALQFKVNPSAVAGSRFTAIQSADHGTNRSLILNGLGGNVTIGSSTPGTNQLDVAGTASVANLAVTTGVGVNGGGFKHQRVTTGSINGTTYANVTLTWTTTFGDANYDPACEVLDATSAAVGLSVDHIQAINAATLVVTVHNGSGGALTGSLICTAVHN